MKKLCIILLPLLLVGVPVLAQVSSCFFENKDAFTVFSALQQLNFKDIPVKTMPSVDVEKLLKEDKEELSLSPEAKLYIFNADGRMVYGPVTAKQNIPKGFDIFLTDLVAGDEVIIQLIEPVTSKDISTLRISKVVHAYKDMFSFQNQLGLDVSLKAVQLDCYNDVACYYPEWETESNGVALILLSSGNYWCTGSLLNNTSQDYKPYFLTAFHCIDTDETCTLSDAEKNAAQNWSFRFRYRRTTCNGSVIDNYITYNHAYFKSAWQPTDFALMELQDNITGQNLRLLGWDKSGSTPSSGTAIHHPAGQVMKISFDNNSLTSNSSVINWSDGCTSPINTHWRVGYDNGAMEGGSSGSPLFDQNHRVVGQLHGGRVSCDAPDGYYGKFNNSWAGGGTNATRLSNWLDPGNTGISVLDGCSYNVNFTNQTVTSNTTVTSCGDINVQNVTVTNGAKLTLDAPNETIINGSFEVVLGSQLEIK